MTKYCLISCTAEILGATFMGHIPWVFRDQDDKKFVVYAHYYEHSDGRRFVGTREKSPEVLQALLDCSDALAEAEDDV